MCRHVCLRVRLHRACKFKQAVNIPIIHACSLVQPAGGTSYHYTSRLRLSHSSLPTINHKEQRQHWEHTPSTVTHASPWPGDEGKGLQREARHGFSIKATMLGNSPRRPTKTRRRCCIIYITGSRMFTAPRGPRKKMRDNSAGVWSVEICMRELEVGLQVSLRVFVCLFLGMGVGRMCFFPPLEAII